MAGVIVCAVLWGTVLAIYKSHGLPSKWRTAGKIALVILIGVVGIGVDKIRDVEQCAANVRRLYPHAYGDLDDMTLGSQTLKKYPMCQLQTTSSLPLPTTASR